ncbi:NADP-dependent 3-hydroxy acid dehydrogenase YdfG [Chitinophaga rupis]|uniref:NADP-dependent 3-hydroxy acid dehydrogenase YdfG n=1 Tax=Chitinophaga rupis TaxID=573321 RepID=A0A1H8GAB4_9BACT|nr:SDR family oxidoreductase [Chitinophaga rupis]SEN40923.1 NADP-dependent 3-hydroxy acid dehydrogenase YdfG [Chitinophaga rupis]
MERIKDKVIVITGASSGIGAATARKLAGLGAKVVLAARRFEQLQALATELGENALGVKTDVSKKADLDNLVVKALERFGKIDVLLNNAGVMPISFFDEGKVEEWERMVDINIKGILYGINAVLPHMLERGSGHILAISSVQGHKTFPGTGVYAGTKFAVRGIMESLREELAGKIKVTTIYPGLVATEFGNDITSARILSTYGDFKNFPSLDANAVADAIIYAISQPGNVTANDIILRPLEQAL